MNNIDRIAGVVNSQCVRLTSSPINEAYCFAGLTLFPDGGKDHCQYSSMDGLTELAWVTGLDSTWTNRVDVCNVITTNPSHQTMRYIQTLGRSHQWSRHASVEVCLLLCLVLVLQVPPCPSSSASPPRQTTPHKHLPSFSGSKLDSKDFKLGLVKIKSFNQ